MMSVPAAYLPSNRSRDGSTPGFEGSIDGRDDDEPASIVRHRCAASLECRQRAGRVGVCVDKEEWCLGLDHRLR